MQDHPDVGILKPLPFDPTKLHIAAPGVSPDRRIENKETGDPTSPTVAAQAVAEPAESDFVAYDAPPVPLFHPDPNYPTWARDAEIQGRVVLHVLVGMDGRVTRIAVRRDVRGLTDAAREAISRWIFRPARSGTHAVAVWVEIPVEFRL
jgi:protein TonB